MSKPSRRTRRNRHGVEVHISPGADPLLAAAMERMTPEDMDAEDRAADSDRRVFAANPGVVGFLRAPFPGEGRAHTPPGCDLAEVRVTRVGEGVRLREWVFEPIGTTH